MKLCHSKGDNLQDIVHDYILVLNYKIARVCKLIDSIHFPMISLKKSLPQKY